MREKNEQTAHDLLIEMIELSKERLNHSLLLTRRLSGKDDVIR